MTPERRTEIKNGTSGDYNMDGTPGIPHATAEERREYIAELPADERARHEKEQARQKRVNKFQLKFAKTQIHRAPALNSGIGNPAGW